MTKVSYCYPVKGNDVAELLSQSHRLPSSGEFNNDSSWLWEIRNQHGKGKFGQGKANFRIFPDKLVLVNAAHSYAWVMQFTQEFAAKRQRISESLTAKDAAASKAVLEFTGVALIETGHESWSYRDRDESHNKAIIRFENGFPIETLVSDYYISSCSSGDMAYGLSPYSETSGFKYSEEEWQNLVSEHQPTLVIERLTRDNGQHEKHTYLLNNSYVPSEACVELLKRL